MQSRLKTPVAALISNVVRFPKRWLLGYLLAAGLAILSAVMWLGVDTDSSRMLAADLPFQERTQNLNRDFPALKNAIVVVVRSELPDAADAVVERLRDALDGSPALETVFAPSVDPFFRTHGIIYQDIDELEKQLDQLNKSASMLARLRVGQDLENFYRTLYTAEDLAGGAEIDVSFLDAFYRSLAETITARLSGDYLPLSWVLGASDPGAEREIVTRFVYATPVFDFNALQPARPAIDAVQVAVDGLDGDLLKVVEVGITGDPVLRFEELRSVSSGIGWSLGFSLLLVAVLLAIAYRSAGRVAVTMVALIAALVITTGVAAAVFGDLNLVSVAFVVLLVGLGLDFSIHVLAHVGSAPHQRLDDALAHIGDGIGGALFLSMITTVIAFLSFVPTDFAGIAQLGVIGAIGVVMAFFVSVTLVPAVIRVAPWLSQMPTQRAYESGTVQTSHSGTVIGLLYRGRVGLCALLIAIVGGAILILPSVRFDADPLNLRDPESRSVQVLNILADEPMTAPYRLSILRADEDAANEARERAETLPGVEEATTLSSFVPSNQAEKFDILDFSFPTMETIVSGDGLEHSNLPDGKTAIRSLIDRLNGEPEREEALALARVLEQLSASSDTMQSAVERDIFRFFPSFIGLIEAQLLIDTVELETLPAAIRERYISESGEWRVDVVPSDDLRDASKLRAFVSEVQEFDSAIAGAPLQIVGAGEAVSRAIVQSLVIASIGVLLVATLVLRSLAAVIALVVPLLIAGLITGGASVLFDVPFNYANVIVLPLLIGLGVDSGVHLVMRRMSTGSSQALFATTTPRAVVFSGLTTIAAFATLSVSAHQGTASMGIMLAIAISSTLICTLVLAPLFYDLLTRNEARSH